MGPENTHNVWVMCVGEEHARSVLEDFECAHYDNFSSANAPFAFVSLLEVTGTSVCVLRFRSRNMTQCYMFFA